MKDHLVQPHRIVLKGVKVHNLKEVCLEFPTQELIVFSGVSGSGKSSLAFDTLYVEGQRRYIESLSNALKRQLGGLQKPDAQSIEGITPTIAIEQKSVSKNPRSTVSTLTGIHDFLRILFAKLAIPHCPTSLQPLQAQTVKQIVDAILKLPAKKQYLILAPLASDKKGSFKETFAALQRKGFLKVFIDQQLYNLDDPIPLDPKATHQIDVVIDTITIDPKQENRILESVQSAIDFQGVTFKLFDPQTLELFFYSTVAYSPATDTSYPPLESQDFSFNHPKGMCETCQGLGQIADFDRDLLIDPHRSIAEGCIRFMGSYDTVKWGNIYRNLADIYGFDCHDPFKNLTVEQQEILLNGNQKKWTRMSFVHPEKKTRWTEYVQWKGILADLRMRYEDAESASFKEEMESLMHRCVCPSCHGSRLKPYPSHAKFFQRSFLEITSMPLEECAQFFSTLPLSPFEYQLAHGLIEEVLRRLKFLIEVGLEYLTLMRSAPTLSGGESQRIRLASQIGSGLIGTTFVLDEPSIGLHPIDNKRLIKTLHQLKNQGNTVIVVEHDEETLLAADRVIDIGPGAGTLGGEILVNGSIQDLLSCKRSVTGSFLRGDFVIPMPDQRRVPQRFIHLQQARLHNLKSVDLTLPLECLVAITGVSGSGKSSLILGTLYPVLSNRLMKTSLQEGPVKAIEGIDAIKKVIAIDQTPIGRTSRSNPATYVKIFDEIRELFAMTPDAQALGFDRGRFSFNVKEGTCHHCQGMGTIAIDMDFMEEDQIVCPLCEGKRFDPHTLSVRYKGLSIDEVLNLSVAEAKTFFSNIPSLERKLSLMEEVGLGYMKLGQSSLTLSGGEAQRVKLAKELIRPSSGQTLYILDEPTTGLHFADIAKLLSIFNRLVEKKNSVIVIEHHMDLVKTADYIIDLGPKGGDQGGYIIATGTPEKIAALKTATGQALHEALTCDRKKRSRALMKISLPPKVLNQAQPIIVAGARQHHLKNIDLTLPRHKITCFTGPSGSGKSSLAFDTLYAEGQRRYVESLSPHLRQMIAILPKPHVDYIEGLSPAIALDQSRILKNPRSTVGTMTEAYDYLRILFARLGVAYCPITHEPIKPVLLAEVHRMILDRFAEKKIIILAPIKVKGSSSLLMIKKELMSLGYLRVKINDQYYELDEELPQPGKMTFSVKVVIDRLEVKTSASKRLYESLEKGKQVGKDELYIECQGQETYYHFAFAVEKTGVSYPMITPQSFLFNAVEGMCMDCLGLGYQWGAEPFIMEHFHLMTPIEIVMNLLPSSMTRPLLQQFIRAFKASDIDSDLPLAKMPHAMKERFLKGALNAPSSIHWVGLQVALERQSQWGQKAVKEFYHHHLTEEVCLSCQGSRLNPLSSAVELRGKTMQVITQEPIQQLKPFLKPLETIAQDGIGEVLDQLLKRLTFLEEIGLGYLSLSRTAPTLSGGELQRIRLSKQLGAGLSGCLYVLDEPTVGLHPHNNHLLNQALIRLKNGNNTLICVEHDPMTIAIADHLVDFGPKAGKWGGQIVAQGSYEELLNNPQSVTGRFLSKKIALPYLPSFKSKRSLKIFGARYHHLKGIDFTIPLGQLTILTGVSGSGKSTVLEEILYKNFHAVTTKKSSELQHVKAIEGLELIDKVIYMEQGPLGQTARADISTYTDLLTPLRSFFASLPEAKKRGLQPKNFSFNHPHGMCPACQGLGTKTIDMKFLSPIIVPCPDCDGFRLNPLSLKVDYLGRHLGQILTLSVDEIGAHIPSIPKVNKIIDSLKTVGLGYLCLNQEINTLSGGEAQRLKLSKELIKSSNAKTLFLLDEPTTGLHYHDMVLLIEVIHSLLKKGCTIVMVEHHLDMIARAHHIIDLGPESGINGGEVVYEGPVEPLMEEKKSHTGFYLKNHLSC